MVGEKKKGSASTTPESYVFSANGAFSFQPGVTPQELFHSTTASAESAIRWRGTDTGSEAERRERRCVPKFNLERGAREAERRDM
jgi:hypothetical protein